MTDKPTEIDDTDLDRVAAGAESTVNTHRFDPYKTFKFRVASDGNAAFDGKLLTADDFKSEQEY